MTRVFYAKVPTFLRLVNNFICAYTRLHRGSVERTHGVFTYLTVNDRRLVSQERRRKYDDLYF